MNILILFSGTKSFSKVFGKNPKNKIRTIDIDNYFKPTYNEDILKWDYKTALKDFKVDYLHSSPICKHFTKIPNYNKKKNTYEKGFILIDKTIEIINWIKKNQNPNLKFTIENPKNKITLDYKPLQKYKYCTTSYCKYDFLYQKNTTFWYEGFDLKLKPICNRKNICQSKKMNKKKNIHYLRIGYRMSEESGAMIDVKYYAKLRKTDEYKNIKMTDKYFRYRIPPKLIEDIEKCLI